MVTHIVVPVRNQLVFTRNLVDQLEDEEFESCWIFDNGSTDGTDEYLSTLPAKFRSFDAHGLGIYEMWDLGYRHAKNHFADYVAILNNDIYFRPGLIKSLADALDYRQDAWISYPDYDLTKGHGYRETHGTYRNGGMSGFCFMLRASAIDWRPLVDPAFKLWFGDDDIALEVERRGGTQVRVVGLPLEHVGQATSNQHPELMKSIPEDRAAFEKKWGKR